MGSFTNVSPAMTDGDAIHDNVVAEIAAIAEKTTPVGADIALIEDSAAANAKKRVQLGNVGKAIKLDDLAAPDDTTDLDVSITRHGLAPKAPNDATKYLDGTGAYSVPGGGGGVPKSYLFGFGFYRDWGGDTDHDTEVPIGICRDDTDTVDIELTTQMTKQIDAAWAAGDDAGGLDAGAVAASTFYFLWVIAKADGTTDILISTSVSAPTMPAGYVYKRRLPGALLTDASANIRLYQRSQNWQFFDVVVEDLWTTTPAIAQTNITTQVPPNFLGIFHAGITDDKNNTLDIGATSGTLYAGNERAMVSTTTNSRDNHCDRMVRTNNQGRIAYRAQQNTCVRCVISTVGFMDPNF